MKMLRALRQIPPFIIGTLYLLLIPAFALLYGSIWKDFYQATSKYERASFILEEQTKQQIEGLFDEWLRLYLKDEPNLEMLSFEINALSVENGKVTVASRLVFNDGPSWVSATPNWILSVVQRSPRYEMKGQPDRCNIRIYVSDMPVTVAHALNRRKPNNQVDWWSGKVVIPESEDEYFDATVEGSFSNRPVQTCKRLEQLSQAHSGFPEPISGGFQRFLYFSTVTITTLGYGDIVPLTDRARLLTALESILGVVLAGLFINNVTAKRNP